MIVITLRFHGDDAATRDKADTLLKQLVALGRQYEFEVTARNEPEIQRKRRRVNPAEPFLDEAFEAVDQRPLEYRMLMAEAESRGITKPQMDRAKSKLGIETVRRGPGKSVLWKPPLADADDELPQL